VACVKRAPYREVQTLAGAGAALGFDQYLKAMLSLYP
jgi:hypothetical protein